MRLVMHTTTAGPGFRFSQFTPIKPILRIATLTNTAVRVCPGSAACVQPPYMAPECFDALAESLTHHMDIYSLGMLLWVMLSGLQPWQGLNMVQIAYRVTLSGERPPLSAIPPDRRPHKLLRLLQSCWEADPQRRPAAAEVVKELMLVQQMVRPYNYIMI
ncbi:hypothetical protein Vretimale_17910 [Volvox reticuliferus]|uniref:Protein kinase domain-containing protein n=1 Tax=Volvox reticuliferus TaxID=1737510 RepID=A0A8J4GWR5_9CHLO|nr:hypothetical protein Vretimale_17910 [Volvox reticuliferus]